ncbi:hypothetical protein [Aliiglaciecola sp. LCG003]|uniref:hypothetical protein n=1 Tax=Aliiglaciecola sp. LCG003 TaxID=3053655 RepID=UPI00257293A3|nr:hypothetical protein [Aliiglaciecola sp. LCG003]WJG10297.1 hypothetical protein QR722_04480 [Aliiglaciecola sp. LCG003]
MLELALTKTKTEYGDFELRKVEGDINLGRLMKQMGKGVYTNFFFKVSITDDLLANFHVLKFPIDRGISGYRIAYAHKDTGEQLCSMYNEESLKRLILVQGTGWLDSSILGYNGFNVYNVSNYESMFDMVDTKRADLFFRGINEIGLEKGYLDGHYKNLVVEPCLAFYYPLPRFFVTNKNNLKNGARVELGLRKAFEDGSFIKLWEEYFLANIERANVSERNIIQLENPFIKTLDEQYKKYNYPLKMKYIETVSR